MIPYEPYNESADEEETPAAAARPPVPGRHSSRHLVVGVDVDEDAVRERVVGAMARVFAGWTVWPLSARASMRGCQTSRRAGAAPMRYWSSAIPMFEIFIDESSVGPPTCHSEVEDRIHQNRRRAKRLAVIFADKSLGATSIASLYDEPWSKDNASSWLGAPRTPEFVTRVL